MPYNVKKNKDGSHTVYKKDTEEKVGTTHGSIKKYLAELYTHVDEGETKTYDELLKESADKILSKR